LAADETLWDPKFLNVYSFRPPDCVSVKALLWNTFMICEVAKILSILKMLTFMIRRY